MGSVAYGKAGKPVMSEHGSWAFTIQLETDPHVIRAVRKVIAATARIGGALDADALGKPSPMPGSMRTRTASAPLRRW
jgi:hypothetical protein